MELTLILILVAVVGTFGGLGGGYWKGTLDGEKKQEARAIAAEAKVQAVTDKLVAEETNHIDDMVTAQKVGFDEGRKQAPIAYAKGAQYVAADQGLSNPVCVMGADSMQFLNSARSDVRTAAAAGGPTHGLRGSGSDNGPVVRSVVPAVDTGRSTVSGVPQQPAQLRGAGQVPGLGVSAHPKPTPIH
jgi:hypothetical protein